MMPETLILYDDTTKTAYRIRPARLSIGGGIALDAARQEITERDGLSDTHMLSLTHYYIWMRYATDQAEYVALEGAGDDPDLTATTWLPFVLNEETYAQMGEAVVMVWANAAKAANPHRFDSDSALKKTLSRVVRLNRSGSVTTASSKGARTDVTG